MIFIKIDTDEIRNENLVSSVDTIFSIFNNEFIPVVITTSV